MRILYCLRPSIGDELRFRIAHARVVEILRAGGHIVDDLDLYAEKADPVMSREGLLRYVDMHANTREVEGYNSTPAGSRKRSSSCFPSGSTAYPRSCGGISSACFCPASPSASTKPGYSIPICGTSASHSRGMRLQRKPARRRRKGDPPLRFVRDNVGALIDPKGRFEYLALYDMNFTRGASARRIHEARDPRLPGLVKELGGRPS